MNVSLEIKKIQKDLELIHDENLINSIKSLLAFAKKQKQIIDFKPFSLDEYRKRVDQSEEDIKMRRFINVADL